MSDKIDIPPKPSLREKIRRLRQTFVRKLPDLIAEIEQLYAKLQQDTGSEQLLADLYRHFHSIKGTAASFGLIELSQAAGHGEACLATLQSLHVSSRRDALAGVVCDLQAAIVLLHQHYSRVADEAEDFIKDDSATIEAIASGGKKHRRKVYICDDDALQAEQLAEQLSCFGYSPSVFTEPNELRAAVLSNQPAAIVMDIVFPAGASTGTELIAEMQREVRNRLPVVFMSSRTDFQARLNAVRANGEAYFIKPIRAVDMVETLDAMTHSGEPEPYRILVVDDDPEVAAYHSYILEQANMATRLLHEPEKILDVLNDFKPDLVLMDMYMPHCSGHELAQVIRQIPEYLSLPIVYLSSETNKHKQVSALRVGAEGFLTKPIQPDDLISAVAIRAERMRTLRSLMVRDGLTGLFNHSFMSQYLETAIASAMREVSTLCFVMIDVDLFKSVNDTYGHPAGDQVLVALSRLLQQRLRGSDMVGRYGGEEFALILPDTNMEEAYRLVDILRESFAALHFQAGDHDFTCTFSAGIASYPGCSRSELLRECADRALYRAKQAGRNCIKLAEGDR